MPSSTAYILVKKVGFKYSFDGVTSISHALSLKVNTDSDSSEGSDYVNNARNEPDVLTLSVAASDASVPVHPRPTGPGVSGPWRMLVMILKRARPAPRGAGRAGPDLCHRPLAP